jgi:hypothetical protein
MSRMKQPSKIHEWALRYAAEGWPVLPLVEQAKRPLTKNGLLDATTDEQIINDWWTRWPNANVGLRTGVMFDVLDIDGEVGRASLNAKAGPEVVHSGPVSRTGRGEHWLYAPANTANKAGLLPKLDWRGVNGYIVAPPSVHPDGHLYAWIQDPRLALPNQPEWLTPYLSLYRPASTGPHAIRVIQSNPYDKTKPVHVTPIDQNRLNARLKSIVDVAMDMGLNPRQSGSRYVVNCVFHEGDNEASLVLYPDNRFYCFGCEAWGSADDLRQRKPGGRRG